MTNTPRVVASIGGMLMVIGMILTSLQTTIPGFIVFFGIMVGAGSGMSYGYHSFSSQVVSRPNVVWHLV